MAKLVYGMLQSLDGYTEDEHGDFDWARPDAEVHAFVDRLDASIGTDIYGRRLYETMKFWQTVEDDGSVEGAWAVQWQAKQKIVVSATLPAVETPRTTLLRTLDAAALVSLKAESSADLSIGGPTIAADAIRAGLVDEFYFLTCPVLVGGGIRTLPEGVRLDLELLEERHFGNGVVFTRYRSASPATMDS